MRILTDNELQQLHTMLEQKRLPKLRTAIYARKSAEDERQTSIPTQIESCKKMIAEYDFLELTHVFKEDNVSGMFTENRNEYLRMLSLVENKELDVIVVMKLDRLARDLCDSSTAIKLLNLYGCYLIAGDDVSDSNTPAGEFMRNILLAQNQFHARRVASDVMATECNNARNGYTAGGIPPYGLKVIGKRFEIDENEAPAIRIMFDRFAKGYSYKQIIDELTDLGFYTRAGNRFSYSTVYSLLRNDKYYGTFVYNRKGGKRKKKRVLIEHFDEVRNSDAIPPIISKELFDEVQEKLDGRQTNSRPRQNVTDFVLTGLLFCKECGGSMSGATNTGGRNSQKYRRYQCLNHTGRRGKTCKTKPIRAEYIESAVKEILTASINEHLASKANLSAVFADRERELREKANILSRHVCDLENRINNFLDKAANPATSPTIAQRYERQAEEYLAEQERKKDAINALNKQLKQFNDMVDCFAERSRILTPEEIFTSNEITREIFQTFIKRIIIDDSNDDIEIIFND